MRFLGGKSQLPVGTGMFKKKKSDIDMAQLLWVEGINTIFKTGKAPQTMNRDLY